MEASKAIAIFNPVAAQINSLVSRFKVFTSVKDATTAVEVTEGLSSMTTIANRVEQMRKETKQPYLETGKLIDERAKQITLELLATSSQLKKALLEWNQQETKRKEAERMALEEAKRKEDEERLQAMARDVTPVAEDDFNALLVDDVAQEQAHISKVVEVEAQQFVADKEHAKAIKETEKKAVKGVRTVWKFEVVQESLLSRDFMTVNESAIRKAVAEGRREIAGVRIYEEEMLVARGR